MSNVEGKNSSDASLFDRQSTAIPSFNILRFALSPGNYHRSSRLDPNGDIEPRSSVHGQAFYDRAVMRRMRQGIPLRFGVPNSLPSVSVEVRIL